MNSLCNDILILFRTAKPEHINIKSSEGKLSFIKIDKTLYENYAREQYSNKSDNEILELYKRLQNRLVDKSFFDLLYEFGKQSIEVLNGIPHVKFNSIIEWRDLSHKIGQNIIVTAYLAKMSLNDKSDLLYFAWPTTLKTNNRRLQNILNKGLSENHYHLNGSSQIFPITWVSLMNNPEKISSRINKLGKNLVPYMSFGIEDNRSEWVTLLKEAAKIRINLFCKLHNQYNSLIIKKNLFTSVELKRAISTIAFFEAYKTDKNKDCLDYALSKDLATDNFCNNRILVGERKFLYDCFRATFCNEFSYEESNAFYKYLLIQSNFRSEFIQSNNFLGFRNFANYQDRKGFFIDGIKKYECEAVKTSLNDVLDQQPVKSLEARIMPKNSIKALFDHINFYDETFGKQDYYPFYYVLHYPKKADYLNKKEKNFIIRNPRNYEQRIKYKQCSLTTMQALNCIPKLKKRIFGIDTCSNEIGCRPEVFATEYRFLRSCSMRNKTKLLNSYDNYNVLGRTYHVGEDFLDISDGLRAIDEVIKFLEFSYGDRFGHALALGINPKDFYNLKGGTVVLPMQDALDNFVWIYNRSNEMNISIEPVLKQKIEAWIQDLSIKIYGNFVQSVNDCNIHLDPYSLYLSWKLRGDNPDLYRKMYFDYDNLFNDPYKRAMCKDDDELNSLRKRKEICMLYYAYHFDYNVKIQGEKPYEFNILPEYILLIEKIQNQLKFEVASCGIMIECNPSSNCLIGPFKQYDKHPITTFNNLHLEIDSRRLLESPQISVSINTDDQGVFDTSLEYEYALMARALIEKQTEDGSFCYSPAQVYEYLDNIRKMGNVQSFRIPNDTQN